MSSLFVAPLSLTLAISPLQSPFVALLLADSWDIVVVHSQCSVNRTVSQLCLNYSRQPATVHLVAEMKIIFSFPWRLETVRRTLATKHGDGATTSDQCRFALSWPVAQQSPPGVKGALHVHITTHNMSSYSIGYSLELEHTSCAQCQLKWWMMIMIDDDGDECWWILMMDDDG